MEWLGNLYSDVEHRGAHEIILRYINNDGVVVGWGHSVNGELGNNARYNTLTPLMVGGLDKPIRIACSVMSSAWLGVQNFLLTMGSGMWGELGVGNPCLCPRVVNNEMNLPICPTQITVRPFDPKDLIIDVTAGYLYFAGVSLKGVVYAWGANNYGQCHRDLYNACCGLAQPRVIPNEKVVEVACGNYTVLARTVSGAVYGWGLSKLLDLEPEEEAGLVQVRTEPRELPNAGDRFVVPDPHRLGVFTGESVRGVRAGPWHFAAFTAAGVVYSWGLGNNGRLGHGDEADVLHPTPVRALSAVDIVEVACGSFHTVFLTADGRAYACGDNQAGQCGAVGVFAVVFPQPLRVPGGRAVVHAACGRLHTLLLLTTGEVVAYGSGVGLGLGSGYGIRLVRGQPLLTNFTTLWVVSGRAHGFAMTLAKTTTMVVLGMPHRGVPAAVLCSGLKDGILACGAGNDFTLLINRCGGLYGFGVDGWGQLGFTAPESAALTPDGVPVIPSAMRVPYFARTVVTFVAAGFSFALCIIEGERVYAWGNNSYGQCGLGVDPKKWKRIAQPREITWLGDKQIIQVACGSYFALALRASGEVYSWGAIECCGVGLDPPKEAIPPRVIMRDVGEESAGVILSPVLVPCLSNIVQVAAGGWHALALNAIGEIYTWGMGDGGRLGLGNLDSVFYPTRIIHDSFFTRINCGCYSSYGIDDDARLFVWGVNDVGQLGLDSANVLTPTYVLDNVMEATLGKSFTLALTFNGMFHMSGMIEFDGGFVSKCSGFDDFDNLPTFIRSSTLAQERLRGLRIFGGHEHVVLLCEKNPIEPDLIAITTKTLRHQPERIIARRSM
ncbi:unnamed protein product [Phytomonas sp. Hart1]|nr:unnamed protein product [Phytomonas sp. Hart1]|eukprot:CCW70188.1 unnamed protein product [Phytomonas sp. isolate Hart1]